MATISFTIPDAQLPRLREAMCAYIGLSGDDVTNANARLGVMQAIRNIVQAQEQLAAAAAIPPPDPPPDLT